MLHKTLLVAFALLLPFSAQAQRRGDVERPQRPVAERDRGADARSDRLDRRADRRTDRRVDRRTDRRTDRRFGARQPGVIAPRGRVLQRGPSGRRHDRQARPRRPGFRGRQHRQRAVWIPGHYQRVYRPAEFRWTFRCGQRIRICVRSAGYERIWVPGRWSC